MVHFKESCRRNLPRKMMHHPTHVFKMTYLHGYHIFLGLWKQIWSFSMKKPINHELTHDRALQYSIFTGDGSAAHSDLNIFSLLYVKHLCLEDSSNWQRKTLTCLRQCAGTSESILFWRCSLCMTDFMIPVPTSIDIYLNAASSKLLRSFSIIGRNSPWTSNT